MTHSSTPDDLQHSIHYHTLSLSPPLGDIYTDIGRQLIQPFWFYSADRQTESQRPLIARLMRLPSASVKSISCAQYSKANSHKAEWPKARFPLPELTGDRQPVSITRQHGLLFGLALSSYHLIIQTAFPLAVLTSTRLVETRPVLTGNGNRSPVNSGSGNQA